MGKEEYFHNISLDEVWSKYFFLQKDEFYSN